MANNNNFFNNINQNGWGVKGLGRESHITHKIGSNEFHITTPVRINGIGTVKIRTQFDTNGNFMETDIGFTDKE